MRSGFTCDDDDGDYVAYADAVGSNIDFPVNNNRWSGRRTILLSSGRSGVVSCGEFYFDCSYFQSSMHVPVVFSSTVVSI